jgi:hypothetical protein
VSAGVHADVEDGRLARDREAAPAAAAHSGASRAEAEAEAATVRDLSRPPPRHAGPPHGFRGTAGAGLPSLVAAFGDLVAAFLVGHYVRLVSPRLRTAAVL